MMAVGSHSYSFVENEPIGTHAASRGPFEDLRHLLPTAFQHTGGQKVTCYDDLERPKTHGLEQRYVSPTTGICRRLVIQSVSPRAPNEHHIKDHTGHVNKLALWLMSTSPFRHYNFFKWVGTWLLFEVKLLWYFLWFCVQLVALWFNLVIPEDATEDSEAYNTGYYKPYLREFKSQLWEARSPMEYSTRVDDEDAKERRIVTRTPYPRLIMIHDSKLDKWIPCTDPDIIMGKEYLAISYHSSDAYTRGPNEQSEKALFMQEVHLAVVQRKLDAYWCDVDCIGETPDEKNLDLYCMADVYRGAKFTLIILGKSRDGELAAWSRWGERAWTLPEALLSQNLLYKFRDRSEIKEISLHQLANLAYQNHTSEQAVINSYGGKDPLERIERLTRLKDAIWQRGIRYASEPAPAGPMSFPPPPRAPALRKAAAQNGVHAAERVYALMGFFEHRIQPNFSEDDSLALARLSMANDNDRIAERMVSLLPSVPHPDAHWYADDDIYKANLWDILPEVQVAGVTENGALVLDGCRAASIRWKDFPEISFQKSDSLRRTMIGTIPYLAWPILIVGIAAIPTFSLKGGIAMAAVGFALLLASPVLLVFSESGRVVAAQPWFIGVKGVLDIDTAARHLYGGGNKGRYLRLDYTPSGSGFAVPDRGKFRGGAREQWKRAKAAEEQGAQVFTLIDTCSSAVYYFRAQRPPTVCLFTGREGGLGRFVLCSERCHLDELHKETVLRMPTAVSEKMEMCGWVALG